MASIHIPDQYLAGKLAALQTNTLKCMLIDISSYNRATDTVAADLTEVSGTGYTPGGMPVSCTVVADTTNHKTTVTFTTTGLGSGSAVSATGAAIIDTTDGNKIVAVDDFQGTYASSGGVYTVAPIVHDWLHF